jgi:hypothetical protein
VQLPRRGRSGFFVAADGLLEVPAGGPEALASGGAAPEAAIFNIFLLADGRISFLIPPESDDFKKQHIN